MTMDKHARTSRTVVTPFKKVNKKSKVERDWQKIGKSIFGNGGNDAS